MFIRSLGAHFRMCTINGRGTRRISRIQMAKTARMFGIFPPFHIIAQWVQARMLGRGAGMNPRVVLAIASVRDC